jgi:hypothetical protein
VDQEGISKRKTKKENATCLNVFSLAVLMFGLFFLFVILNLSRLRSVLEWVREC